MPDDAAARWNLRYLEEPKISFEQPRSLLLEHANLLPNDGLALDLAMGLGGNARFLLQRGLRVIGVDISSVAAKHAKSHLPSLMAVVADLEHFYITPNQFDVIIDFLYLQRDLWLPIANGLKKGGVLFVECLTDDMLSLHPEINPMYLVKPDELYQSFTHGELVDKLEILYYHQGKWLESSSHHRVTASLVARRNA